MCHASQEELWQRKMLSGSNCSECSGRQTVPGSDWEQEKKRWEFRNREEPGLLSWA